MNRLRVFTPLFIALVFVAVPSAFAGQVSPVRIYPVPQMADGPVPWPAPGLTLDGPVPWPGGAVDAPIPCPK